MISSNDSKSDGLFGNLLQLIDERFGEHEEDLSTYNWLKEHINCRKDFSYSGNLRENLTELTKQVLREIDGKSRNTLPCDEE